MLYLPLLWAYKADIKLYVIYQSMLSKVQLNSTQLTTPKKSERVVNVWNHLPSDIVEFTTLSAFERTIKLVDFTDYLNCVEICV